jgi:hypothetical protein
MRGYPGPLPKKSCLVFGAMRQCAFAAGGQRFGIRR